MRTPDPRFAQLGDEDGIEKDDEEFLDWSIEEISDDLSRDVITFDEISIDRSHKFGDSKYLSMSGIDGKTITGRKMEVTLRYEVPRP